MSLVAGIRGGEVSHTAATAVLCIAVGGVTAQWVAARLQLPAIVLLFLFGLLVGPVLQVLQPSVAFGPALRPVVGLAVAIVVFEGGLALDFRELKAAGDGVFRLTAVALPISFSLASLAAFFVGRMPWGPALLYGGITVVTGPTVVLPLLRNTRLQARPASFFKWEAIVNDPIGALIAAIVLGVMVMNGHEGLPLTVRAAEGLFAAVALGVSAALLFRHLVHHDLVQESLKTPMLIALTLGVYVLSNMVMEESGLGAATIFGISLANMRVRGLGELTRIKESLVVLIVSALFIVLTANLGRELFSQLTWQTCILTVVMIFVVRPVSIALATLGSDLSLRERLLTSWIAPRGIVAAAVASVAGGKLAAAGHPGGELVMPAVFTLIASTMILHGFSLRPLSRLLELTLGEKPTLAILGATPWTEALAGALITAGSSVVLIDTFAGALRNARLRGITCLEAELLSEHGMQMLREHRVDYLFAGTQNEIYNSLVCSRLAPELGRGRVFQLASENVAQEDRISLDQELRGHVIGNPPLRFSELRQHTTDLISFETFDESVVDDRLPLLIVRPNGSLLFESNELPEVKPAEGDKVLRDFRHISASSP